MAKKRKESKHKRYSPNGKVYYYYYRKKRGPRRKRHVKPKPKPPVDRRFRFRIVRCTFKKQVEKIGSFRDIESAQAKKRELLALNKTVEFPKTYVNNKRNDNHPYGYEGEYLLLERCYKETDNNEVYMRNEYGKMVKYVSNNKDFKIYEKFPYVQEETFWVYGYDQKTERKTYRWVSDNLIQAELDADSMLFINVYIYKNKVIFRYDDRRINITICKNTSDSIRMYNKLSEEYKKNKKVMFTGAVHGRGHPRCSETVNLIVETTGWPLYRVYSATTMK